LGDEMWCKGSSIPISFLVIAVSGVFCLAACPSVDLTGDCFVSSNDFAVMAAQWLKCDHCVPDVMAFIPGGTFEMGDNFNEGHSWELPVHTVTVDSFYMGKYEIINGQYCDYLNDANSLGKIKVVSGTVYASLDDGNSYPYCDTHSFDGDSQIDYSGGVFSVRTKSGRDMSYDPMVQVSWYGAAAYCNWRSDQEGYQRCYNLLTWNCDFSKKGYRLATEAEWEYAARGGLSGRRFPWGGAISHSQANYYSWWDDGSPYYPYDVSPTEGFHPRWDDGVWPFTSPVGSFSANGNDLYDMAGNVWEWCNDWYDSDYYDSSPSVNPQGPAGGTYRVIRGGGWNNDGSYCRVSYRYGHAPSSRYDGLGFRLALDSEPACPSADLTGDCFVDYEDFALMAAQWLTSDPCVPSDMVWVDINDPGVSGHEGFVGEMSKYETTNAQYCEFLNAALASGDIYVSDNIVYGSNGSNSGVDFVDEIYFDTFVAEDYSQIDYNDVSGSFSVRTRDDYDMSDHPVVVVSWYGATAFCNYYGYRLPTEWEWQAVADYDGSYTYGCGTTIDHSKANYGSSNPLGLPSDPYTSPVEYHSSYGYGMNDTAGNVWEWTDSWYSDSHSYRVLRGGGWYNIDHACTVSYRGYINPDYAYYGVGFRVCR